MLNLVSTALCVTLVDWVSWGFHHSPRER